MQTPCTACGRRPVLVEKLHPTPVKNAGYYGTALYVWRDKVLTLNGHHCKTCRDKSPYIVRRTAESR